MRTIIAILVCAVALWAIDFNFFGGIYFRAVYSLLTLSPQ